LYLNHPENISMPTSQLQPAVAANRCKKQSTVEADK